MSDKLSKFIEAQNKLTMKEWEAFGDIDGNDPRAVELAAMQGKRFGDGMRRFGYVYENNRWHRCEAIHT